MNTTTNEAAAVAVVGGQKLTLNGRTYLVSRVADRGYVLTGARGADYLAMRLLDNPSNLYVTNINGQPSRAFAGVTLTDASGTLEVYTYKREARACAQPTLNPDDSIKPCILAPGHDGYCDGGVR